MKTISTFRLFVLLLFFSNHSIELFSQDYSKGIFEHARILSDQEARANFQYDSQNQSYEFKGNQQLVYQSVEGNFLATANFELINGEDESQELGWYLTSDIPNTHYEIKATKDENGLTTLKISTNKEVIQLKPTKRNYEILQLERNGNQLIFRGAHRFAPLEEIGAHHFQGLPEKMSLGIYYQGGNEKNKGISWNIRVDKPRNDASSPYYDHQWMGCRMEVMDVFTGRRKVIYTKESTFEAPNWMPNEDKLLFNMDGRLWKIPSSGGEVTALNTGLANRLNNDHCISFDGKILGISHSNPGESSKVYYLPIEGGEPTLLTPQGPSYLHGWSPDGKEMVYIAKRPGSSAYDIFKKSIYGGEEINLTNNEEYSHADGSEYSPDGKYIYYNGSVKGGSMEIFRMKPDGTDKEQLTFDSNNNWFPHISPDGKWMVYISFDKNIEMNSHPSFKRVELKLMATSGGAPKTIAYLYGGQGTINVNSWSPDGKHIAFVSNSE